VLADRAAANLIDRARVAAGLHELRRDERPEIDVWLAVTAVDQLCDPSDRGGPGVVQERRHVVSHLEAAPLDVGPDRGP